VIAGAGPAGSTLATLLAMRGIDVLLLDKSEFPRDKTCGDAVSPRALKVLKSVDLFDSVREIGFEVRRVAFYAPNCEELIVPIPSHDGQPDFCSVLPRYTLDEMVRRRAIAEGADFRANATVIDVLRDGERIVGVRARTSDGIAEIRARFTVLATGASLHLLKCGGFLINEPAFSLAARTYYQGVRGLSDVIEFHYNSVPLPGYGWVFPISATAANVGVGFHLIKRRSKISSARIFEGFTASRKVSDMLIDAEMIGPIKGYPIRFDFPTTRVSFPGLLLIGEACGLVNPLTGEGIDYALECAEIAAEVLSAGVLNTPHCDYSTEDEYSRLLRARFLKTFKSLLKVRSLYMQGWVLNRYVSAAKRSGDLAQLLVNIGLGNIDPLRAFSPKELVRIALG
jgi:geranylgeranyl reductase family protein